MIKNEINNIFDYSTHSFADRSCFEKRVGKASHPFKCTKDGYTTVVSSTEASTSSVLILCTIGEVLCNKQKSNKILALDSKRQKMPGQ